MFNHGKVVKEMRRRTQKNFGWRPKKMLRMLPTMPLWGMFQGAGEGTGLLKQSSDSSATWLFWWLRLWRWWRWGEGWRVERRGGGLGSGLTPKRLWFGERLGCLQALLPLSYLPSNLQSLPFCVCVCVFFFLYKLAVLLVLGCRLLCFVVVIIIILLFY